MPWPRHFLLLVQTVYGTVERQITGHRRAENKDNSEEVA